MIESLIHLLSKFPIPDWAKRYPDKYQHAVLNLLPLSIPTFKLSWFPQDKQLHMLYGAVIFFLLGASHVAFIVVCAVALGKEIYDYFHPDKHSCDFSDFTATIFVPSMWLIFKGW